MCQRNSQLYQWNCYLYKYTRLIQVHLQVWLPWRRPKLLHSRRQVFHEFLSPKADICSKENANSSIIFGALNQPSSDMYMKLLTQVYYFA